MLTNTNPITRNPTVVIGVDHGYGNIKTANTCFPAGVVAYEKEPIFAGDALIYNGAYYSIGEGHKEFIPEKMINGFQIFAKFHCPVFFGIFIQKFICYFFFFHKTPGITSFSEAAAE